MRLKEEKEENLLESEDLDEESVGIHDLISSDDEQEGQDIEKELALIDDFVPADIRGLSHQIAELYNRVH